MDKTSQWMGHCVSKCWAKAVPGLLFLFPLLLALSVLLGLGLRKSRIGKTGVAETVALKYFIHCCLCSQALPAFALLGRGLV